MQLFGTFEGVDSECGVGVEDSSGGVIGSDRVLEVAAVVVCAMPNYVPLGKRDRKTTDIHDDVAGRSKSSQTFRASAGLISNCQQT